MKRIKEISCMLYLLLLSAGCTREETGEAPQKVVPIELSKRIATVDHRETRDTLIIESGNGGYYAVPRYSTLPDVEPSKAFNVSCKEDTVFVERILLEELTFTVGYYIMDKEGQRKTILIQNPGMLGIPEFDD